MSREPWWYHAMLCEAHPPDCTCPDGDAHAAADEWRGLVKAVEALAERWEKCADRPSAWGPGWDEASCLHAQALRAVVSGGAR